MALEDRGRTPGGTWQTSFDTRPQCHSRTSSVWLGPTPCRTASKLELRRRQKQNDRQQTDRRRRRGQTEQRAPTGAKPNRAGTDADGRPHRGSAACTRTCDRRARASPLHSFLKLPNPQSAPLSAVSRTKLPRPSRLSFCHLRLLQVQPCHVDLFFHYRFKTVDSLQTVPEMDHLWSGDSV